MGARSTLAELVAQDRPVAVVLSCVDPACGRVKWRDIQDIPADITTDELRARARCDWCGGIRGLRTDVGVIRPHFSYYPPTEDVIAYEIARLLNLRDWIRCHPFGYRRLGQRWGHSRPDPALLDVAHYELGLAMCNLYSNLTTQEAARRLFNAKDRIGNQPPLPAIFPDAEVPIVRINSEGERELTRARWGWNKAKFGWVTNVRNLSGWPWKHVIEETRQRCLVPATSFSEYHPTETILGKTGKPIKAATWFRLIDDEDRPPFAFAGVMRRWSWEKDGLRKKADEPLCEADTQVIAMAFLTTDPNAVVEPIHPKAMPVILRTPDEFDAWLTGPAEVAQELQRPLPDDALEIIFTGAKEDPGEEQ